ncbi:hypothetical protein EDD33_1871 [Nocardioides aurantiacus]|uniref:Uncharacterized protein n=1 Tax=Nocardioides aurantiacus TaxID=86796 RepID=A0A3N2CTZ2_9ACTN|nr:hypothetical protein EDD33_1871 [Nocardioides aurantiacus]
MPRYRRLWSAVAGFVLALSCAGAGVAGPIVWYAFLFVTGACAAALLNAPSPLPGHRHRNSHATHAHVAGVGTARVAAWSGALLVAVAASMRLSPWLTVALGLVTCATHPAVASYLLAHHRRPTRVEHLTRRRPPTTTAKVTSPAETPASLVDPHHPDDSPDVDRLDTLVDAVYLEYLTNAELCLAWRQSYTWLQRAETTGQRSRVVACRERYLTELCRRDAAGVEAWLRGGGRAASGPDKSMGT